jgi:hypothetical protein
MTLKHSAYGESYFDVIKEKDQLVHFHVFDCVTF